MFRKWIFRTVKGGWIRATSKWYHSHRKDVLDRTEHDGGHGIVCVRLRRATEDIQRELN
jgi:hypothetical protein